jgi:hypothetical protein
MPKSRGRPPPKKRSPIKRIPPQPKRWAQIGRWLFASLLAVCTIVGGLIAFLPRVTVDPEGSIDPSKPYPISFKITNGGIIPLWNVQPMMGLCQFTSGPPQRVFSRCNGPLGSRLLFQPWRIDELSMDERYSIRLDDMLKIAPGGQFGGAEISIIVEYSPWFLPLRRAKEFGFITRLEDDGHLTWLVRPVQK